MAPWQLSNSLLDDLRIRPRLGKGAHVEQVGPGKALHLRESIAQILGEPLDHLHAPSLKALPLEDVAADLPVEQHQLPVHAPSGPLLFLMDTGFQLGEPGPVIRRQRDDVWHRQFSLCQRRSILASVLADC
jgi:hypothetical protein